MKAPDDDPADEKFAALLGDYDEALAQGHTPGPHNTPLDPDLRQRLADAQECLSLLESAWPRANPATVNGLSDTTVISRCAAAPVTIGRFEVRRELGRGGN